MHCAVVASRHYHRAPFMLDIAALCLVVTALLTYLNHRLTRLPMAIGVMVIALGLSPCAAPLRRIVFALD